MWPGIDDRGHTIPQAGNVECNATDEQQFKLEGNCKHIIATSVCSLARFESPCNCNFSCP